MSLEDQASTRLALLLDLERDREVVSIRLLFPSEKHAVEHGHDTKWLVDSLRTILESGQLRGHGIYSVG
jgi:hypothetical protein